MKIPNFSRPQNKIILKLLLRVGGVAWSRWQEYIQIFADVIINHKANQKRTYSDKYCIDCQNVNLRTRLHYAVFNRNRFGNASFWPTVYNESPSNPA